MNRKNRTSFHPPQPCTNHSTNATEDPKNRNKKSRFQVVLLLILCALSLQWILRTRNRPVLHKQVMKQADAVAVAVIKKKEWPPGGVDWDTGEEAVKRSENKNPVLSNEIVSNKPQRFLFKKGWKRYKESALFHKWLGNLRGIEIGSSAHNGFGLNTLNVDFTRNMTIYKEAEIENTGVYRRVDIVSPGNRLPYPSSSLDFVLSSHAVEHLNDPIGFMCEAARVVKSGGYIASIVPLHGAHPPDMKRNRTLLKDVVYRHDHPIDPSLDDHHHWQVWMVEEMIEMYRYMNFTVVASNKKDDKVGNGFSVIVKVPENKFDINC